MKVGRPNELGESVNTGIRIPAEDYATLQKEVNDKNHRLLEKAATSKAKKVKLLTIADLLRPVINKECQRLRRKKGN